MPNADYQSIYRGTEMDDRWGKAGTAVQGVKVNGTEASKDAQNKVNLSLNKATVGLGNVDNTSDANKPVSTAQAAAIAAETTARQNADATLTASINAEALARQQADAEIDEALANKANKDGYYEQMGVGVADNLAGKGDGVPAEFTRRPTGGTADVADGVATFKSIDGNTIGWNQLVKNGKIEGLTNIEAYRGTVSESDGAAHFVVSGESTSQGLFFKAKEIVAGHKYFISAEIKTNVTVYLSLNFDSTGSLWSAISSNDAFTHYAVVFTSNKSTENVSLRSISASIGKEFSVKNIVVFDLTQMFGAGNEPTTVAEFEALFPASYYPYNEGQLLSLNMTGIKTDGFNQWDEEWELGAYNNLTGEKNDSTTRIRSKNYIPCFGNTAYYCSYGKDNTNDHLLGYYYDADMNYISGGSRISGQVFTTPANARYMAFCTYGATTTSYDGDICINISHSGVRNGEYEPYWTETRNIPVTTIKGKVNGQGASVVIFPDGMKSAGTAHDEIVGNKAIKRIGVVDLGSLNWAKNTLGRFISNDMVGLIKPATSYSEATNIITIKYRSVSQGATWVNGDICIRSQQSGGDPVGQITILDNNYSDAAAFKAAMSGVMLYYELAEPIEYIIDEADVPNYNYKVSDFGTETLLPEGVDEQGVPKTSPIKAQIVYGMNAVDTLRNLPKNYISRESMDNILVALVSAGVIGGYILVYNESTQEYDCTITPNA